MTALSYLLLFASILFGKHVGKLADDECKKYAKYLFILRDVAALGAIAIALQPHGLFLEYVIPVAVIVSFYWFWKRFSEWYWYIFPLIIFLSAQNFIIVTTLVLIAAYINSALQHKVLAKKSFWEIFQWPVLLSVILFGLSVILPAL